MIPAGIPRTPFSPARQRDRIDPQRPQAIERLPEPSHPPRPVSPPRR
jgi:hypothetical protein